MPLQDDSFEPRSPDEIFDAYKTALEENYSQDPNVGENTAFYAIVRGMAEVLAQSQEQDLQTLYRSAYLPTAEGHHLDRLTRLIGVQRNPATKATGVAEFRHDGGVDGNYPVAKNTIIRTEGSDPVDFQTTSSDTLSLFDDFSDNDLSEYTGDTGSFSTQNTTAYADYALQADATSGTRIARSDVTVHQGTEWEFRQYLETGAIAHTEVGVTDANNTYRIVVDEANSTVKLEVSQSQAGATVASDTSVSIPTGEWLRVVHDWDVNGEHTVSVYDASGSEVTTITGTDDTFGEGHIAFESGDATANKYWDRVTTRSRTINIRATEGGTHGNVGPEQITVMPSPPSGIDTVTNPLPTGDESYTNVDGGDFIVGTDTESDDELRERAKKTTSIGGAATIDAMEAQFLADQGNGVEGVTLFENKTDTDNTGSGGLPPTSFELVVYGGSDKYIGETLHEIAPLTGHDYGGAHGTKASYTVDSDVLDSSRTWEWSRPPRLTLDMTIDLVHDDTYVGKKAIRQRLVEHIGGTDIDGVSVIGTRGIGEDVYVGRLEDIIVGSDTGVVGISNIDIDTDGDGTDDTTTNGNGLRIVPVADNEVATTNGEDGSITVNETSL